MPPRKKGALKDQGEKLHIKTKLLKKIVDEEDDEEEYIKQVSSRQDDDWIGDDDGSDYVEDGRDIFDDDLDMESIASASAIGKGTKRKKKSVSENAGKRNLQFMLSNIPSKKKEETKIDNDAMLSKILEEIDKSPTSTSSIKPKPMTNTFSSVVEPPSTISSENPNSVLKEIYNNKPHEEGIENIIEIEDDKAEESIEIDGFKKFEAVQSQNSENVTIETDLTQGCSDNDVDMTQIEEFESQILPDISMDETEITDEIQAEFISEWENIANEPNEVVKKRYFVFIGGMLLRTLKKQKGTVFLFGKTYCDNTKSYLSCCVAVRNIERQLFFLPRPNVLDKSGQPTDKPVTFMMVYNEVKENIMKPLQIDFRARYIHKKFAFDPEVPTESYYMEVRYPASDIKIYTNLGKKSKTFSKVFGTNTSFLEILLLDRKIKGPCWLDVHNPIPVSNQISWCKFEVDCQKMIDLKVTLTEKPLPPPPLVTMTINLRSFVNPKTL
ncbi:hypothetical protein NQ317_019204 [Molorchus minor]|uniref:DNA polymerase alpha catalytic subunit n=1 Tax=Molorchus minor TaxID=1323400 RepID=A0ABQ9JR02_9CUCU|nr:hypothetical protein NQ317_019204 [Molorchus minor]